MDLTSGKINRKILPEKLCGKISSGKSRNLKSVSSIHMYTTVCVGEMAWLSGKLGASDAGALSLNQSQCI